jgi:hypothetical protein
MFHYVPSTADNRHFGVTKQNKTKNDHEHLIKDDYSSVKDLKNENNEINESSWIAKLVNGIQEHSLEEVRGTTISGVQGESLICFRFPSGQHKKVKSQKRKERKHSDHHK